VKKLVILAAVLFATTAWAKTFDGCGVRFSYPEMSHAQSVCDRPAGEREMKRQPSTLEVGQSQLL